jgi:serine/threonine-protein kinase HipA
MRQAKVLFKNEEAGVLVQHNDGSFTFLYHDNWIKDSTKRSISITLPKAKREFHSHHLFPFFYNMLPEGSNKEIVCALNRIDFKDDFGVLITTAKKDNIGAVQIVKIADK